MLNIVKTHIRICVSLCSCSPVLLCCLSASHVVVPGWEDEDVLIVGYTEEPTRKRRRVTDEGVCLCE